MQFEWDEEKRRINLRKHRLDFADAERVFARETITFVDDRFEYNEERFGLLGILNDFVVKISYTELDDTIRLISMRKATKNEQFDFYQSFGD